MKPQKHRKNTKAQLFRNTAAWKRTRAEVNRRDIFLCRLCLRERILQPYGLSTHHIIPLEETMDYATDVDWCITLCDAHHKAADDGLYSRDELHDLAIVSPALPE